MDQESKTLQTSQLHEWVGVCAKDKGPNDIFIEVTVPELNPILTGTLDATTSNQSVSLTDLDGGQINSNVTTKTTITAYYYGGSTNRKYPPDVVKGEQVRILKLANSDKYYWESMGRDDGLRMTETYRLEVKNRKNFDDPSDDAHTYSIELDSKTNKHVRILTSTGNGEKHIYALLIDTANSKVQLSDEIGNAVTIDSENSRVIVRNSQNAFLMLNGLDAMFAAPRDLTIKAGRQLVVSSPLATIQTTTGTGVLEINSKSVAINASSNVATTSPSIGMAGAVSVPQSLTASNLMANNLQAANASITNPNQNFSFSPASINIAAGIGVGGSASNVGSTGTGTNSSSGSRHAVAWEQFEEAMAIVVSCFNSIQQKIGVPTTQSQISPLVTQSEMTTLTGN